MNKYVEIIYHTCAKIYVCVSMCICKCNRFTYNHQTVGIRLLAASDEVTSGRPNKVDTFIECPTKRVITSLLCSPLVYQRNMQFSTVCLVDLQKFNFLEYIYICLHVFIFADIRIRCVRVI